MSMVVKPGYVNPLTMMGQKKTGLTPAVHTQQKGEQKDDVKDLETKQQGLQNQILLMKSTGAEAGGNLHRTESCKISDSTGGRYPVDEEKI